VSHRPTARKRLAVDRQQLLILLVAAVMSGSFFLLVLWPKQKELSAIMAAVDREKPFVKQKVRTSREGVYVTVRVASLRKAGGTLLRRVPAEPELASFLEQVARCVASDPLVRHEVERIEAEPPKGTPAAVTPIGELYLPLEGLVDVEAERRRIEAEIGKVEKELSKCEAKLGNANFVERAKPEVVERERERREAWRAKLEQLREMRGALS